MAIATISSTTNPATTYRRYLSAFMDADPGSGGTTPAPGAGRNLERAMGIEPTPEAWEAAVLPLNYARSSADSTIDPSSVRRVAVARCRACVLPYRNPVSLERRTHRRAGDRMQPYSSDGQPPYAPPKAVLRDA